MGREDFIQYEYDLLIECSEPNSKFDININPDTGAVTAINKVNKNVAWNFKNGTELIEQLFRMCQINPTKNS